MRNMITKLGHIKKKKKVDLYQDNKRFQEKGGEYFKIKSTIQNVRLNFIIQRCREIENLL